LRQQDDRNRGRTACSEAAGEVGRAVAAGGEEGEKVGQAWLGPLASGRVQLGVHESTQLGEAHGCVAPRLV